MAKGDEPESYLEEKKLKLKFINADENDVIIIFTHITSHENENSNSFRIYLAKYDLFAFILSIFINSFVITTRDVPTT